MSPTLFCEFQSSPYAKLFIPNNNLARVPMTGLDATAHPFRPAHVCPVSVNNENTFFSDENSSINNSPSDISDANITNDSDNSVFSQLSNLRSKNSDRVIIAHLNINSIRNKFEMISELIIGNIDIILLSETKIDNSFTTSQFIIPGFSSPFRNDRTRHGGGLLLYVRKDIPAKLLRCSYCEDIECLLIEVTFHKKKWLIYGTYNPNRLLISDHLSTLSNSIDKYAKLYDNIVILGDFNAEPLDENMQDFCNLFNLKNLIKEPTCFKNPQNPSCIDLILTNRSKSFQDTSVIETGLSDCHKLTISVLKMIFKKQPPTIISYRDYKRYSPSKFRTEIDNVLSFDLKLIDNDTFVNLFMEIFNKHAPIKFKYIRANNNPFMTKELRKAIMLRSKLRNRLNKNKTLEAHLAYKRQRNLCTSLLRKCKRNFYGNLNPSVISDNKTFWKIVKPFFSDKVSTTSKITLSENDEIQHSDSKIAEIFGNFFSNIALELNIANENISEDNADETDPIIKAINKYEKHPSILKIKESFDEKDVFLFSTIEEEIIVKEIYSLNELKATPNTSIPPIIIKENCDIFSKKLYFDFNTSIALGNFPSNLKYADVTPVYKKGDRLDKSNYRPISILPVISKIFERFLFYQINDYMDPYLSIYQCGFRKHMSAQNCLLFMLEKWKNCLDMKGSTGVLLTDLSKAFDCLKHDLLIAKLSAYGFGYDSIKLLYSYLTGRSQRVRVNSNYSSWSRILFGVPQGSILGPLLFNIYLSDLFILCSDSNIINYADDNSPFSCNDDIESVIAQLTIDSKTLLEWFANNGFKANPDKFHFIASGTENDNFVQIQQYKIYSSKCEKLLGIKIDNKLSFEEHVTTLCRKAAQKLHALARIAHFMSFRQRRIIMKSFINSQFGYCPLVWMFHSRKLNNRINNIHERALRIVFNDYSSTFQELLIKDNSVTIHIRNIQVLAIELYKVANGFSTVIMSRVFPLKESLKYPTNNIFKSRNVRTVTYGTESLAHLGPKIWKILPDDFKSITSVKSFKIKIKQWNPTNCPCKLCKLYIAGVGYID